MTQLAIQLDELDGDLLVANALERLGIDLSSLLAETAVWASPEVFQMLKCANAHAAWYPMARRAYEKRGEKKGQRVGDIRLDDNTYANVAIKRAVGKAGRIRNLHTCHVWPRTAYDERYYACIANLVLLPRSIAGLSDHHPLMTAALQYRSFELYGWYPADIAGEPQSQPVKPSDYPSNWRDPEPMTPEIRYAVLRRSTP